MFNTNIYLKNNVVVYYFIKHYEKGQKTKNLPIQNISLNFKLLIGLNLSFVCCKKVKEKRKQSVTMF